MITIDAVQKRYTSGTETVTIGPVTTQIPSGGVTALVGPIAPHFEQPGGGEQVLVPADGIPEAQAEEYVPVNELLGWGYLEQRPAEECVASSGYALGA